MKRLPQPEFLEVVSWLPEDPREYFDFPSTLLAFGESLTSSRLVSIDGCIFRQQNDNYSLATFTCSGSQLGETLRRLLREGKKIRVANNFISRDFSPLKSVPYMKEYVVGEGFNPEFEGVPGRRGQQLRRELRLGREQYQWEPALASEREQIDRVFEAWVRWSNGRHFMTAQGHYKAWLRRYWEAPNNCELWACLHQGSNLIAGFVGFEIFRGAAQLTLVKHLSGDSNLATFLWSRALREVLSRGASRVFCGSTDFSKSSRDTLKTRLGLPSVRGHKPELKDLILAGDANGCK